MSMWQVADAAHGLSFRLDSPLDMRYDRTQSWSAFDVVNRALPQDLEDVLFSYTDERWARRIVEFVVASRRQKPIERTSELAQLVEAAIPAGARRGSKVHAATKTFAALRLAVNTEYWALDEGVRALCSLLNVGARLVLLTYSSHEDRIVKHLFRRLSSRPITEPAGLVMPSSLASERKNRKPRATALSQRGARESLAPGLEPLEDEVLQALKLPGEDAREDEAEAALMRSGWGQSWIGHIVTRKPVEPGREEIEANPLSRSCKLRAIEKTALAREN
jgi:16S rRNA C1402 N4-methylase RsmH